MDCAKYFNSLLSRLRPVSLRDRLCPLFGRIAHCNTSESSRFSLVTSHRPRLARFVNMIPAQFMKSRTNPKPNMKTKILIVSFLVNGAFLSANLMAQAPPPPPPGGPGPHGKHGKHGERPPPPPRGAAEQISGVVAQYILNANGEADGLLLADGTQIKFPPHMSADLVRTLKPNDSMTAQGNREQAQVFHAFTITNTATSASLAEARPSAFARRLPPELRGVNLKPMEASGNVKAVLRAPRGEVEGAILADGTVVRVQKDVGAQFANLFVKDASLSVKGYGTTNALGRALLVTEIGAPGKPLTAIYGADASASSPAPPLPPSGTE